MSSADAEHVNGQLGGAGEAAEAPAWFRTARPRRVAILGWARLSAQAWEGSGYNLSASELARGLAMAGHEVSYLQSGMTYRGWRRKPSIVHRETWGGVRCFDLRNSPNLSPAASNFDNMNTEMSCPAESALVLDWLDQIGSELVHIHSLEGYGLDLIAAIRRGRGGGGGGGRPVVVTPHNYWYVCPQVDLLYREHSVCMDYDGGRRCVGCLPAVDARQTQRRRARRQSIEELFGPYVSEVARRFKKSLKPTLRRVMQGKFVERWKPGPPNPDRLVDPELAIGYETVTGESHLESNPGGLVRHDWRIEKGEGPRELSACTPDMNERFVRSTHHLTVLNNYGRRRVAGIDALNAASLVTPPSRFLLRAHVSMGLIESKARWVRLGQPHFDQINRRARRSPFYEVSPWDPKSSTRALRLGFYGTTRNNKGLEVLLQAIPLLDPRIRQRCQFNIRALGNDWPMRKRMCMYPEVSFAGGYDLLQLISSAGEFDVGILPHIWFENSPLVMLEYLHAGKFTIASNLGGPPDWIKPPKNGLLFAAGRPDELASHMTSVVTGVVRVPSPREVHEASAEGLQSYPGHVREVDAVYQELLSRGEEDEAAAGATRAASGVAQPASA
ncbi:MAG: glycosyltransferase [Phycisphaerales bacterium]